MSYSSSSVRTVGSDELAGIFGRRIGSDELNAIFGNDPNLRVWGDSNGSRSRNSSNSSVIFLQPRGLPPPRGAILLPHDDRYMQIVRPGNSSRGSGNSSRRSIDTSISPSVGIPLEIKTYPITVSSELTDFEPKLIANPLYVSNQRAIYGYERTPPQIGQVPAFIMNVGAASEGSTVSTSPSAVFWARPA